MRPLVVLLLPLAACNDTFDVSGSDVGGIFLPDARSVTFSDVVDNTFFPLPVGATWSYTSDTKDGTETNAVEVLQDTKRIQGVTATVVHDAVSLDGVLTEDTFDWYAQDEDGNVWYLGEDTCELTDGQCTDKTGSWEWGVDGAKAGVVMWAEPQVNGQTYYQEYLKGEAEDAAEVVGVDEAKEVPAGSFTGCVRTRETTALEPDLVEEKVYCPGVGTVYEKSPDGDVFLLASSLL